MLKLNHISKTFAPGTVNEKRALNDLTLHLAPGDFVTVIGSNGAGKSTMFNAIAGTFQPDSGSVILDGKDITRLPDYKRSKFIGRMFQDPLKGTAPNMTIEENLALAYLRASNARSPFSMVTAAERKEFREKLSQLGLGLEDRMNTVVGLLSGGQRQALTLLMATLVTPKLLLLDEHTAALDPKTAAKVLEATEKIVQKDHRGRKFHYLPDGHPQRPVRPPAGQPDHYDEGRQHRHGAFRPGAGRHHHRAAPPGLPQPRRGQRPDPLQRGITISPFQFRKGLIAYVFQAAKEAFIRSRYKIQ